MSLDAANSLMELSSMDNSFLWKAHSWVGDTRPSSLLREVISTWINTRSQVDRLPDRLV